MPALAEPLWLMLLVSIPVIRWLHRFHAPLSSWTVSALFPFAAARRDTAPGRSRARPDPAWRRRALASALLILALAGPYWHGEMQRLTVWIDDSLSQHATEAGQSRLESQFGVLSDALDNTPLPPERIELRSLGDPAMVRTYRDVADIEVDDWLAAPRGEPNGPPAVFISRDSSHWLLSDGASVSARSWATRVGPERILQAGSATENAAVVHLAARRNIDEPAQLDVLVGVVNTGNRRDVRRIELGDGVQVLASLDVELEGGETRYWQTASPATAASLTASLSSGDVLGLDDELTIDLDDFVPLGVRIEPACGAAVGRAVTAHPSLKVAGIESAGDIGIICSATAFAAPSFVARNYIRVFSSEAAPVSGPPAWAATAHTAAQPQLPAARLWSSPWPDPGNLTGNALLFAQDGSPLILVHPIPPDSGRSGAGRMIDTNINLRQPEFVRLPEFAVLVAVLADLASGRQLLWQTALASRSPQSSVIRPVPLSAPSASGVRTAGTTRHELSTWLLIAAALVLLFDAWKFGRARLGAKHA